MSGRSILAAAGLLVGLSFLSTAGTARADFATCADPGPPAVIGTVGCMRLPSALLGGTTAFSYFVPPACSSVRCPTLYLLHGFGGDYTSMLGTAGSPSAW